MLSIDHPSALVAMGDLTYGHQPFRNRATGRYLLALKVPKEAILAARANGGFKIYLVPAGMRTCIGLVSAFFDDHDEPMTIRTPSADGDQLFTDLLKVFTQDSFEIYFFDEHDRELLGQVAAIEDASRLEALARSLCFPKLAREDALERDRAIVEWFSHRKAHDDDAAFEVKFREKLYPDDFMLVEAHRDPIRGSEMPIHTSLERDEPGNFQEQDIARLLLRVFPWESVIINPIRADTGRELCDILVSTDDAILVVQAKDSPNTVTSLGRSIDRKIATSLGHLIKATAQLRGALGHLRAVEELKLTLPEGLVTIPLAGKELRGLIILNEMFDYNFDDYSEPVLTLSEQIGAPNVVMDYGQLHTLALRLPEPGSFFQALDRVFGIALENGEFPRSVYLGAPPGKEE